MGASASNDKQKEAQELAAVFDQQARKDMERGSDKGPGEACRNCPYKNRENFLRMLGEQQ